MKFRRRWLFCRLSLLVPGAIMFGGCLGGFQNNLDVFFSPGALDNRMIVPFVAVLPLLEIFLRASRGFNG